MSRMRSGHRGFTLIEAIFSMLIVGVMLVAALNTLGAAARARQVQRGNREGVVLARDLLGEILQCRYVEPEAEIAPPPGLDAGESSTDRSAWDDVDDYDGWSSEPPKTKANTSIDQFAGWTRSVDVIPVDPGSLGAAAEQGMRLVQVTVTSPGGVSTTLSALRADLGDLEQAPTLDTTYLGAVNVEIQIGPDASTRVFGGVDVLNQRPPREEPPE